ncbi:MAG: hypothetical protein QM684_19970 [Rhizobium sp.]
MCVKIFFSAAFLALFGFAVASCTTSGGSGSGTTQNSPPSGGGY